jgi:hypothetical protein
MVVALYSIYIVVVGWGGRLAWVAGSLVKHVSTYYKIGSQPVYSAAFYRVVEKIIIQEYLILPRNICNDTVKIHHHL